MNESDLEYCTRRASEELEKAQRATLPTVEAAHRQLADFYLTRAKALAAGAKPTRRGR